VSLLDTRKEWQILDNPETFYEKYEATNGFNCFNVFLGAKLIKPFIASKEEADQFAEEKNQEIRSLIKEKYKNGTSKENLFQPSNQW
jgi:hypothetical protein